MDKAMGAGHPGGIDENNRQEALLAWATERIARLTHDFGGTRQLDGLLDWVAWFTREHFGLQQRLLTECGRRNDYLLERMRVHSEFRRRLAQLCIDTMRRDTSVAERLNALCHDLLADARAQQEKLAGIVREAAVAPKVRRKPRPGGLASLGGEPVDAPDPVASEAATLH